MKALSGVERKWSGAPAVPPPAPRPAGRPLLAAGGRIGSVVPGQAANPAPVPPGPRRPDAGPSADNTAAGPGGWLLGLAVGVPSTVAHAESQARLLRPHMSFDPASRAWTAVLGSLDAVGLSVLQACFTAARDHGADVRVQAVPAPAGWRGRVFDRAPGGARHGEE
ncbi:hypothetical protein [Streptomyces tendae]